MGSHSHFYFRNTPSAPGQGELEADSPYLTSKYHVPLLWMALFEPKDIVEEPDDDGEDIDPRLVKPRGEAIAVLASRESWLLEHFPGLRPIWLAQFKELLDGADFPYVHLDSQEIGSMVGTGEAWKVSLEKMLGIFDGAPREKPPGFLASLFSKPKEPGSWAVFDRMLGPAYKGKAEDDPWPYCGGSGDDRPMPWEPEP